MLKVIVATLLFGVSGTAIAQNSKPSESIDESKPVAAASEKITDRKHPDYVRCRTETVIGSLAKKRRICMTNKQWIEMARSGNQMTDEFISSMRSNSTNGR